MERIRNKTAIGIHAGTLRMWGMLFLLLGIIGKCILQNRIAGLGQGGTEQLLGALEGSAAMLVVIVIGVLLQMAETCAIPIFSFLLVEGFQHTSDFKAYILRVLGLAVLTEIPYNLAYGGKLIDISARNPVFALVLCLVLLYFYSRYPEKTGKNRLMKALLTIAALIWAFMLGIQYAIPIVAVTAAIWGLREKPRARNVIGATVCIGCSLISLFMVASPMGFLAVHFYNGEQGADNRIANYLAYPAFLLAIGLVGLFL